MKKKNENKKQVPKLEKKDLPPQFNIYDMEININSILGFVKGWDIKYSNIGIKQNEKYKKANSYILYNRK